MKNRQPAKRPPLRTSLNRTSYSFYVWFGKNKTWQEQYARRFQEFQGGKGLNTFEDQFNVDGSRPEFILPADAVKKLRQNQHLAFVYALWNAQLVLDEDGYFHPYYDGRTYSA